jgi:hypothetical protein
VLTVGVVGKFGNDDDESALVPRLNALERAYGTVRRAFVISDDRTGHTVVGTVEHSN